MYFFGGKEGLHRSAVPLGSQLPGGHGTGGLPSSSGKRASKIGAEFVLVLETGWGEMKWGETTWGEVGWRGERVRGDGAGDHKDLEQRTPWSHAIL